MNLIPLVALFAGLAAHPATAADQEDTVVKNPHRTAEVHLDRRKKSVEVRMHEPRGNLPPNVEVTFYDRENHPTHVELQAAPLPATREQTSMIYQGTTGPFAGSYAGVELKIPFTHGEPEVLRSDDR